MIKLIELSSKDSGQYSNGSRSLGTMALSQDSWYITRMISGVRKDRIIKERNGIFNRYSAINNNIMAC